MLKNILRNINILNALLLVLLALFINYGLSPRTVSKAALKPGTSVGKSAGMPGTQNETEETGEENGTEEEVETKLVPQEYKLISDMNLFHPDRSIPKIVIQKPEEKLPPPDFVLNGTIISDSLKLAYIEDRKAPYTTPGQPGGAKRNRQLKIGDTLSGFTVKEIDHEKVVMVRNNEEIIVKKSATSDKSAPAQQQQRGGAFPQSRRGGSVPHQPQPQAPLAPPAPPTIITVPAAPVQPAATQPASSTAPKTQTQPVGTPGTAQKTPQQQNQQKPKQ